MRKPKLATFFTVAQAGSSFLTNVPSLAITASVQPPTTSVGGPGQYVFTYFIAPSLGGTLGNDANDGTTPTVTGQTGMGGRPQGPWTIGSLFSSRTMSPTAQQIANNNAMSGVAVGMVGDKGVLSLADVGRTYPLVTGSEMVLSMANGISATQVSVLASCNSSKQYVRGLAVVDGGCDGTQVSSAYMIGRFAVTNLATDSQYCTIDGLEVRNCMGGGIVFGNSSNPIARSPGWTAINNYVHHVYNCNEGFSATGCSQSGTTVVIGTVTRGTVNYGQAPSGLKDQLFGIDNSGNHPNDNGGYNGSLTAFVSGTPGGAGTYTSTASGTSTQTNLNGSIFAGNNTAGISFHGPLNSLQSNNFIENVIDLNSAIPLNRRATGIKNWTSYGAVVQFNTIYATLANGGPVEGIEIKNTPQRDYIIRNNYVNLTNSIQIGNACYGDDEGASVTVPDGHFMTCNNNIFIVGTQGGAWGYPREEGPPLSALIVNWYSNTMIALGTGTGGWSRFNVAGHLTHTWYNNIVDRVTVPANSGDWRTNVDTVALIDYNLWPNNYQFNVANSGSGTTVPYSSSQNGGISGAMAALNTASSGGTVGLEHNGTGSVTPELGAPIYVNASGTKLKASDYQLAPTSPGFQKGRTGGTSAGAVVDKGAWGGQTQIGCNFRDPSG